MDKRLSTALTTLTAAAGLTLAVVAGTAMARDRPVPRGFGATAAPSSHTVVPTQGDRTPRVSDRQPAVPEIPAWLAIPAVHTQARVVPVTTTGGELDVPDDPMQVGWWTGGARIDQSRGTVVIDGHVDSATTGPGALFRITDLRPNDLIVVTTASGQRRPYTVTGRRVYRKSGGLPASLFATTGTPRLALITCGGPFDHATGSYLDNVVVFAIPVTAHHSAP